MQLKICEICKRPFLERHGFCPRCPRLHYEESRTALGCLILMFLPLALIVFFWAVLFFVLVMR